MSDSATPCTVAHHAPLSMRFPKQEYWSKLPFPSSGDLPDPEIEHRPPELQADSLPSEPQRKPGNFKDTEGTHIPISLLIKLGSEASASKSPNKL